MLIWSMIYVSRNYYITYTSVRIHIHIHIHIQHKHSYLHNPCQIISNLLLFFSNKNLHELLLHFTFPWNRNITHYHHVYYFTYHYLTSHHITSHHITSHIIISQFMLARTLIYKQPYCNRLQYISSPGLFNIFSLINIDW